MGAGDIASCGLTADTATAKLLAAIPGTVFTAGDNAYESGTATEYAELLRPHLGHGEGPDPPGARATTST